MASIFTTEDNVTIPGNFGKTISVPYFLQFVPGIVTEVITSDASFKSNNVTHFTNTIIAMPHITNQPKPRKANLTNSGINAPTPSVTFIPKLRLKLSS